MTLKIKTENENEPRVTTSIARAGNTVADVISSTPVVKQGSATGSPSAVGVARQNPVVTPIATVARAVVKKEESSADPDEDAVNQSAVATPDQTASSAMARAVSVVKQEQAASLAMVQNRKRSATTISVDTGSALGGTQRKRQKNRAGLSPETNEGGFPGGMPDCYGRQPFSDGLVPW